MIKLPKTVGDWVVLSLALVAACGGAILFGWTALVAIVNQQ